MSSVSSIDLIRTLRESLREPKPSLWQRVRDSWRRKYPEAYARLQLRRIRRGKGLEL